MSEFWTNRLVALFDEGIAIAVTGIFIFAASKIKIPIFLNKFSLRWKVNGYILVSIFLGLIIFYFTERNLILTSVSVSVFLIFICNLMISSFSAVGIINVFPTTEKGIMPAKSLTMIQTDVDFLGIGGAKLTDHKEEFVNMLKRIKSNAGKARFLLSLPDNQTLESLANKYGRDEKRYQLKVIGSAREITSQCESIGVEYELRFYNLDNRFSLPAFRLMLVDKKLCIFSFLNWTKAEGLDNPQMIVRKSGRKSQSALYKSMLQYFDSLWESDSAIKVSDQRAQNFLVDS
ncbi:hypothetical protein HUO14_11900 [Parasphingorhabdus flavimaris]|uniref:PLD phosphodiesterase domain-containing protein n=1 Tax=Parasphingorhabdus flavimaris TaxID=266812 RepID=A0ABX2N4H2_9SPHN|nr:hypothetical protein [Parasphingorhabdus flavimaris]NVD28606.1 hypothetical protein [Parasphingorhabdus flavimaris]